MPKIKQPKRGGLYTFGREMPESQREYSEQEIENLRKSAAEERAILGTPENAEAFVQTAENEAWAILERELGLSRAYGFVRFRGESWRPMREKERQWARWDSPDRTFVDGEVPGYSHINHRGTILTASPPWDMPRAMGIPLDGKLEWAAALLRLAWQTRRAMEAEMAGRAVSYALALAHQWEQGTVEFDLGRIVYAGRTLVDGVDRNADQRRGQTAPRTLQVLKEMHRYVMQGKSVSHAAELTYKPGKGEGIGKSAEANRKLWHRHRQKPADES
ncbi:MAG: hypothetical protein ACFE0P_08070 [Oceanicaulis sp.]